MSAAFDRLREIVARLRAPDGCPWDREQTHQSLRQGLLEETYEVLDAIDAGDDPGLREELGDLVLQAVMHAQIAQETDRFNIDQVLDEISDKLVRRHPHVFGDGDAKNTGEVLKKWEEIKSAEKGGARQSRMDGIPNALPALIHATKAQKKAARAGFDWADASEIPAKIREEIGELEQELGGKDTGRLGEEIGDLFFSVVNLARKLGYDSELLLREASGKFILRFRKMEQLADAEGLRLEEMGMPAMDALWERVKREGKAS